MPWISPRSYPIVPLPVDGGSSDFVLNKGMIEAGVVVSVKYSVNVTTAGTAVRARAIPIRRILLKGDNGVTLQAWKAVDLLAIAQVFDQAATGALVVPPSGFAIANYTLCEAHIPLSFEQRGEHIENGDKYAIPTWAYNTVTLTIEWGSVTDLLVGAPVGLVTFTPAGAVVTQEGYGGVVISDGRSVAAQMPVSAARYYEFANPAVANLTAELMDIGNTTNVRGLLITCEAATGEPTNGLLDTVSLVENGNLSVVSAIPWASLRARNARTYGVAMPTGVAIIDFADDGDLEHLYLASMKNKVKLIGSTLAVAGTIRTEVLGVLPPKTY
jgi:hypothetical protein